VTRLPSPLPYVFHLRGIAPKLLTHRVPLYEAKMIHHYDHRWATYESDGETVRDRTDDEKRLLDTEPLPRYWVPEDEVEKRLRERGWDREWLMGWGDVTNATNERTEIVKAGTKCPKAVGAKFPKNAGLGTPQRQLSSCIGAGGGK